MIKVRLSLRTRTFLPKRSRKNRDQRCKC